MGYALALRCDSSGIGDEKNIRVPEGKKGIDNEKGDKLKASVGASESEANNVPNPVGREKENQKENR